MYKRSLSRGGNKRQRKTVQRRETQQGMYNVDKIKENVFFLNIICEGVVGGDYAIN